MKSIKIISLISIMVLFFISCDKETGVSEKITTNNKENTISLNNNSKDGELLYGGDYIYGEGWIGWIDPKLVIDPIESKEVIKDEANKYGEWAYLDGVMYAHCPRPGGNCGNLVNIGPKGERTIIGLYINTL
jgi:hypothetical protein